MTYYDEISQGYEELHKEEQLKKIKLIKKHFDPKEGRILDVGCGTGITTECWSCERYGIDPAFRLIERARQKDNITYKVAAAENIPYPDNYFDYVVSITAVQNFEDIEKGLREIQRVGKKSFVISALKKSKKIHKIRQAVHSIFKEAKEVEEHFDIIFFVNV